MRSLLTASVLLALLLLYAFRQGEMDRSRAVRGAKLPREGAKEENLEEKFDEGLEEEEESEGFEEEEESEGFEWYGTFVVTVLSAADGKPVRDALVRVSRERRDFHEARTGADGRVTLPDGMGDTWAWS